MTEDAAHSVNGGGFCTTACVLRVGACDRLREIVHATTCRVHTPSRGDVRAAAVQEKPRQALFLDEERTGAKNITDRIWPVVMARALKMRTQVSIPVSTGVLMWINGDARTEKGRSVCGPRPPNDCKEARAAVRLRYRARDFCFDHTRAVLS